TSTLVPGGVRWSILAVYERPGPLAAPVDGARHRRHRDRADHTADPAPPRDPAPPGPRPPRPGHGRRVDRGAAGRRHRAARRVGARMSTEAVTASRAHTGIGAVIGDYVKLTKPRVISLLLVTTAMAMFIADGGAPDGMLLLWTMVGGYLAAGGANAI